MKHRMNIVIVFTLMVAVLTGCGGSAPPDGEGYVLEKTSTGVLIIDRRIVDAKWNEIMDDYDGDAIVLRTNKIGLKQGQKVRYWLDGGVNTSYPAQAFAKKIQIINEQ